MRTLLAALLSLLCTALPAAAGSLEGKVADRSGGVLPGATITLLNIATGQERLATTGADGRFSFPDLRTGLYRVAASLAGFSDASRTLVLETDAQSAIVDFTLEIGSVRAEVTVSADRGPRDLRLVPLRAATATADLMRAR